jgi:hypothetical protein
MMQPTDLLPRLDGVARPPQPTPVPIVPEVIELPPRVDDIIKLYKRFRREWQSRPLGAFTGWMPPRLKLFDELSFDELFRLNSLWHCVERPLPPNGDDAKARHARLEYDQWQEFYYYWAQPNLAQRWAERYGLVRAGGRRSYRRLFGKHAARTVGATAADYPPCCDHTTLWRREGQPSRFAEVFVTQPYSYDLDKMVAFAKEQGLWFWISERPAWHFPLGVFFIEWANPASQFAALRATGEADAWMRTIHAWKREELLPGPGTVVTLKDPMRVKNWRDRFDVNSLMWAELTRLLHFVKA